MSAYGDRDFDTSSVGGVSHSSKGRAYGGHRSASRSRSADGDRERAWAPPAGGSAQRGGSGYSHRHSRHHHGDYPARHSGEGAHDMERLGRNLSEAKGLLGHLRSLNGNTAEAFLVTRDRSLERESERERHHHHHHRHESRDEGRHTMQRLMEMFLEDSRGRSEGIVGAYERWQAFLSSRVREIADLHGAGGAAEQRHRQELTRIVEAYHELRLAHARLSRVVAPEDPPPPPSGVSAAELAGDGLGVAALLCDEAGVVNAMREAAEAEMRALRERASRLAEELDMADETHDVQRDMHHRMDEAVISIGSAVDNLRSTVLSCHGHEGASLLDVPASGVRPGLDGEVDRMNLIMQYLVQRQPQGGGTPGGFAHDEMEILRSDVARLEGERAAARRRAGDLEAELAEVRRAGGGAEELEEVVHAKNATIRQQEVDLAEARRANEELEEMCHAARAKNDDDQDHYEGLLEELASLRTRNKQLHGEMQELREGANAASTEALYDEVDTLKTSLKRAKEENRRLAAAQGLADDLKASHTGLKDEVQRLRSAAQTHAEEHDALRTEAAQLRDQLRAAEQGHGQHPSTGLDDLYDEIDTLKDELQAARQEADDAAAALAQQPRERGGGASHDLIVDDLESEIQYLKGEVARLELKSSHEESVSRQRAAAFAAAATQTEEWRAEQQHNSRHHQHHHPSPTSPVSRPPPVPFERSPTPHSADSHARESVSAERLLSPLSAASTAEAESLRRQLDDVTRELQGTSRRLTDTTADLEETSASLEEARDAEERAQADLELLDSKLRHTEDALREREAQLQDAYDELNSDAAVKEENVEMREKVRILEEALHALETRVPLSQSPAQHSVQSAHSAPSHLEGGVHREQGMLGSLLTTDDGYNTSLQHPEPQPPVPTRRTNPVKKRALKRQGGYPFLGLELGALRSDIGGHGGLRVVEVRGPSLVAGLMVGDIITEVDGVVVNDQDDIRHALRGRGTQDAVYMKLIRNDTLYEVDVQPSESDIAPGQGAKYTTKVLVKPKHPTYTTNRSVQRDPSPQPRSGPARSAANAQHRPNTMAVAKELAEQANAIFKKHQMLATVPPPPSSVRALR